jgi:hypothetical protein
MFISRAEVHDGTEQTLAGGSVDVVVGKVAVVVVGTLVVGVVTGTEVVVTGVVVVLGGGGIGVVEVIGGVTGSVTNPSQAPVHTLATTQI